MCIIFCVNFLGFIVLMSLSCYIFICYYNLYKRIFKRSICFVMCVSFYLIGLLLIFLNLVGIGDYLFNWKSLECIWDCMIIYYYMVFFMVIFVWVFLIVIGIFYCLIFIKFWVSIKRILYLMSIGYNKKFMYFVKFLFLIYVVFVICWIFYVIFMVVDCNDLFLYEIYVFIMILVYLYFFFNWLVLYYINILFCNVFNKLVKFDKCFKKFLKKIF